MNKKLIVSSGAVSITKRISIEIKCPKNGCDHVFDVSQFEWGVSIECPKCKNVIYNPEYDKERYDKKKYYIRLIIASVVSFFIGLFVNYIYDLLINN